MQDGFIFVQRCHDRDCRAFPLSGVIIANKSSQIFGGWVGLFYCFGIIGLVWFVLFACRFRVPETHPTISKKEMEYIVANRGTRKEAGIGSTVVKYEVWKILLTNKHALALYFNHFTNNWSCFLDFYQPIWKSSCISISNHLLFLVYFHTWQCFSFSV